MKIQLSKLAALAALIVLSGCGGGASSGTTTSTTSSTTSSAASAADFPSGVSGSSPTSLSSSSTTTVVAKVPFFRSIKDWGKTLIASLLEQDAATFNKVLVAAVPISSADAASPSMIPESVAMDDYIAQVAAGTAIPTSANLSLNAFFGMYTSATCYGPQVAYASHDNGTGTSPLPGGDTGMWLARESNQTTGKPCSAAQLDALMKPLKQRINATFIFAARMRALASTSMPVSGSSTDVTTSVNTFFQGILPTGVTGTVSSATISNALGVYTYTVEASGTSSAKTQKIVMKIVHDGTVSATFSGLASYVTYDSSNSCTPLSGIGTGTKINAGTVRYSKTSSTAMNLSSREAVYCLSGTLTSTLSDYVAVDSVGELDSTKTACSGTCTGQNAKGWIQDGTGFKRVGASYDPATHEGNFKFAWQAGILDSNSRMFAMNVAYNTTTLARTGKAFFGFSGAMNPQTADSTPTDLKGMICNWAGPGNSHTANNLFQYQEISLPSTASDWDITTSKIAYAPTNSCNSTATMQFDVNADTTLGATEGNSITNSLDTLDAGKTTVQATIEGRGFVNPTLY